MPAIRLPGLPDFTDDPANPYSVEDVQGWWDSPGVRGELVASGGAHGLVAAGPWTYAEKYPVLSGAVILPFGQQDAVRRAILKALPIGQDSPIYYLGQGWEPDKQIFVRPVDVPSFDRQYNHMTFSIKLVQADPLKYAMAPLEGDAGVFTGDTWYRTYDNPDGSNWARTYANPSGRLWTRSYSYTDTGSNGMANAVTLDADADVLSQRLTVIVRGPLQSGWYLRNETTGERLWTRVAIGRGSSITFNCQARTAYLDAGSNVGARTFGDWLTLAPGRNVIRLYGQTTRRLQPANGNPTTPSTFGPWDAYFSVSALPAYL